MEARVKTAEQGGQGGGVYKFTGIRAFKNGKPRAPVCRAERTEYDKGACVPVEYPPGGFVNTYKEQLYLSFANKTHPTEP